VHLLLRGLDALRRLVASASIQSRRHPYTCQPGPSSGSAAQQTPCGATSVTLGAALLLSDPVMFAFGRSDVIIRASRDCNLVLTMCPVSRKMMPQHNELDSIEPRRLSGIRLQLPMSRVLLLVTLLVTTVLVERGSSAITVVGDLDPTFGVGGTVTSTGFSTEETTRLLFSLDVLPKAALAIQPDSKVVAAAELLGGGFGVVRYLPDGTPDGSFGVSGRVNTFVGSRVAATAVIVQPDGKVVAGGFHADSSGEHISLARYEANGSLDPTFNGSGTVTGESGLINALALQPDGKLVWAGVGIGRYLSTGVPDPSFGSCASELPAIIVFTSIVLQPDGKVLVSGVNPVFLQTRRVVARFSPDGCLDPTFGVSGLVFTDFTDCPNTREFVCTWGSIGLQTDGRIVVAGTDGSDFVVARYLADGRPDPSFGATGQVATDFSGETDAAFALALRADGRITVVGATFQSSTTYAFGLARYNVDGTPDESFGSFGKLTSDLDAHSFATGVALRPDGKLVVAGLIGASPVPLTAVSLTIARYLGDSEVCPVNTLAATPQSQLLTSPTAGVRQALNPTAFRRLRDQKLAMTPHGRRLVALYNEHSSELSSLLLKDAALRSLLLKGLLLWQPHVSALVESNRKKSPSLVVTPEQARVVDEVADRLMAVGSRKLAQAIARERNAIPPGLSTVAGLLLAIDQ
jgi:uncharacterized delta-60 repeat protein